MGSRRLVMTVRKLPIGIQNFASLRNDGYLYVDKTAAVYRLAHEGRQYFLSRPRRFGESLLLSTLRAYWEGRKELFSGLIIEELEKAEPNAWIAHPVFYIDFNRDNYRRSGALEGVLEAHLKEWEKQFGCEDPTASQAIRFQNLLRSAHEKTGHRCVILVDEYDKPLLDVMDDPEQEESNKAVFKGFFSALKSFDEFIKFVFITGVTKFSKVSIFSDINQLNDISLNEKYAEICGITGQEMLENFSPEISSLAESQNLTYKECVDALRKMYDGYLFHQKGEKVYNPFSLLNAVSDRAFRSYWFETGTPSFLVKKLRVINFDVRRLSDQSIYADDRTLTDFGENNPNPIPLLYQTGYLTIIGYDSVTREYLLGFPNEEVKYGFLNSLMPEYIENYSTGSGKDITALRRLAERGDVDGIRDVFAALFASIPYTDSRTGFEHDFQTVIYLVFTLLGQYVHCEVHSANGRADCILETARYIYIFEFKRDGTAEEALRQIEEKGYALPYLSDVRKCYKIGAAFDSEKRTLKDWSVSDSHEV